MVYYIKKLIYYISDGVRSPWGDHNFLAARRDLRELWSPQGLYPLGLKVRTSVEMIDGREGTSR